MKKEVRTVVYDEELRMEAYHFEGIVQPFPNHFHEYYVIGFVEDGARVLSCKNQEYTVTSGNDNTIAVAVRIRFCKSRDGQPQAHCQSQRKG